jgi:tetratricopeptide (TPR) repeat protein
MSMPSSRRWRGTGSGCASRRITGPRSEESAMSRDLSQNERRLAALAAIGVLWGAFLIAIGFSPALVVLVLGGALVLVSAHLQREELAPHIRTARGRAVVLLSRVRESPRRARRLNRKAAALRGQGRLEDAVEPIEEALEIFRRIGDRRGEAVTLSRLGLTQARIGDEAGALDSYEAAVAILTELGDSHGAGRVLANLGALQRGQGDEEQARATWIDALERLEPGSPEHDRTAQQL